VTDSHRTPRSSLRRLRARTRSSRMRRLWRNEEAQEARDGLLEYFAGAAAAE